MPRRTGINLNVRRITVICAGLVMFVGMGLYIICVSRPEMTLAVAPVALVLWAAILCFWFFTGGWETLTEERRRRKEVPGMWHNLRLLFKGMGRAEKKGGG